MSLFHSCPHALTHAPCRLNSVIRSSSTLAPKRGVLPCEAPLRGHAPFADPKPLLQPIEGFEVRGPNGLAVDRRVVPRGACSRFLGRRFHSPESGRGPGRTRLHATEDRKVHAGLPA